MCSELYFDVEGSTDSVVAFLFSPSLRLCEEMRRGNASGGCQSQRHTAAA